jgi:NADPH2:quinone reductase
MRAIVAREIGSLDKLAIEDLPAPRAGAGEVVVDMRCAAVNFPDLLMIEGKYQSIPPLPFVPGMEGAGVVAEVAPGIAGLRPGDRVMVQAGHGAFAERLAVKADRCYPVPEGVGFDAAAAIGIAYQTAHFSLVARAAMKKGETVLVAGASGSVGIAALQLAKAFGGRVIAGLTTMAKAAVARENGADHVIDLAAGNPRDSIRDQVKAATGGGVDVALDMVGGEVFEGSLRALNWDGRLVVVGFTSGAIPTMKVNYALLKNIAVTGVNWSGYRERDPARVLRVQDEIWRLFAAGGIRVPVQARFPLDGFAAAFAVIRDRQIRGKVVLDLGPSPHPRFRASEPS